tara:strand:+ start:508 stop:696 length:189 start_codon:yes stop_codon:yes gene_type:complete
MNHLEEVGESYLEHGYHATKLGLVLIGLGLLCLVHAVLPFCLSKVVSSRFAYIVSLARRKKK